MLLVPSLERTLIRTDASLSLETAFATGEATETKDGGLEFDPNSKVAQALEKNIPVNFHRIIQQAASAYKISSNPADYILVPVPIIITDTPNRNGVSFPSKETAMFSPSHGMPHYKTWIGKPTYEEHDNQDIRKAKGIILDAVMNPIRGYPKFYKIVTLLAFDRTKDRGLYNRIKTGILNSYSMGAFVGEYRCSFCGAKSSKLKQTCSHIDPMSVNFYMIGDKLVHREALFIEGFEVSAVKTPAYRMAVSDYVNVMDPVLV